MISATILLQVTSSRMSYEAWTTLESIFNTSSKSHVIHLQNQLHMVQKDSLSIDNYFAKITAMAEELQEAGIVIDDRELSLIALNGLDE